MFWAQPITAHPTTSFLCFCSTRNAHVAHQTRPEPEPEPEPGLPSPSYATLHRPHQTPCHFPHPHATTAPPRCCRTPATTSALRRRRRRRERCSPPPSPHPPRPSPPLIRWARAQAPSVISPPHRPSTLRAGTGAPCRGWSLPRATWPPPPRRRVIKVTKTNKTTHPLSPCRYLKAPSLLTSSRVIGGC